MYPIGFNPSIYAAIARVQRVEHSKSMYPPILGPFEGISENVPSKERINIHSTFQIPFAYRSSHIA